MKVDFRSVFVAPKDKLLVSVDLSQAESWIVAYLADEKNMKYALHHSDIHCQGAGAIFVLNGCGHDWEKAGSGGFCKKCKTTLTKDQRYLGKRNNHASSYGMGPDKKMRVINADSDKPPYITITLQESKQQSDRWHSFYQVKGWWEEVRVKDRVITTSYGRIRHFYGQWGDALEREKIAHEPQSTVADHFNGAIHPLVGKPGGLLTIYRKLIKPYKDHKIINQSHDSCILELPKLVANDVGLEAMVILKRPIIIKNEEFTIPVDGEIGDRWSDGMEKLDKPIPRLVTFNKISFRKGTN